MKYRTKNPPIEEGIARSIPIETKLPPLLVKAAHYTPGAEVTPDGLRITIMRRQKPEQGSMPTVRGGIFYSPAGRERLRHAYTGKTQLGFGYGGTEKIEGTTLLRRPLLVMGSTGSGAIQGAFQKIKGKAAQKSMEDWASYAVTGGHGKETESQVKRVQYFIEKYGDPYQGRDRHFAEYIIESSRVGNQLYSALLDLAAGQAAREDGYDSIVGVSWDPWHGGVHRISEIMDLRESTYPIWGHTGTLHPMYESKDYPEANPTRRRVGLIPKLIALSAFEPFEEMAVAGALMGNPSLPCPSCKGAVRPRRGAKTVTCPHCDSRLGVR